MKELIERSYEAIKKRGLIDDFTTLDDFFDKIKEEYNEVMTADSNDELTEELADLATVCLTCIKFIGKDPVKEFEKVIIKNEKRSIK